MLINKTSILRVYIVLTALWMYGCQNQKIGPPKGHVNTVTSEIPIYSYKNLSPLFNLRNDTTYIVNFWATWCKPCVKELPYIVELKAEFQTQPLKWVFVSIDDERQFESLLTLSNKLGIKAETVVLDEPDFNSWINKVDPNWSGAIPITLIFNKNYKRFYERSFEKEELKEKIIEALSHQSL